MWSIFKGDKKELVFHPSLDRTEILIKKSGEFNPPEIIEIN
jgi:hypothetical protein